MKKKILTTLALIVCAVLLVVGSVAGTIAYLTSIDEVKNTFTVGNVKITLDESKVTPDGVKDGDSRVKENKYHLIPGHTYVKDPVVHVTANSEKCYVFVKLVNGLNGIVSDPTIENQILGKGWTALDGVAGVYYQVVEKSESQTDLPVFAGFTVNNNVGNDELAAYNNKTIEVTAYAVQFDGMQNVAAAWNAVKDLQVAQGN